MFRDISYKICLAVSLLFISHLAVFAQDNKKTDFTEYGDGKKLILFEGQILETENLSSVSNIECSDKNICTVTKKDGQPAWIITINSNLPPGSEMVTLVITSDTAAGLAAPSSLPPKIQIRVLKLAPAVEEKIQIKKSRKISELLNLDNATIEKTLILTFSDEVKLDGEIVTGVKKGVTNLTIKPRYGSFAENTPLSFSFDVVADSRTIEIENKDKRIRGLVGDAITSLKARVFDEKGGLLPSDAAQILWRVRDDADKDKVVLSQRDAGSLEIYLVESSTRPIFLVAEIKDTKISDTVPIFIEAPSSIVGFGNIEMRLNLMDDRTAKDLFGGVATDDYMIAKLRVFNKIPQESNGGPTSSILFFSEGLEVNVSLEKKPMERLKKREKLTDDDGGDWRDLTLEDIEYVNNWVYVPDVDETLIKYYIERTEKNCSEEIQRLTNSRRCEIGITELDRLWYFYEKQNCIENADVIKKSSGNKKDNSVATDDTYVNNKRVGPHNRCDTVAMKNWIPFRPYAFMIIAGTHDRRSERSNQERGLRLLKGLASAASFATTFAPAINNSGFVFGLDKNTNLLLPTFERLFPSRREIQRKNILDMVLQPVEEIPFGKEVTKLVFIPKKNIQGVLPGYNVRITTISVSKIKAEASLVQKQKVENR